VGRLGRYGRTMRIMVTNDDGIDSLGLHHLAWALRPLGEVYIVAPYDEFSGASAAIGALHIAKPEVHEAYVDDIDEAWSVAGPPALCVLFARLGAFGPPPDLVVSGINPGANVGRSVYHSGTIGATLTARTGGITGIAISQAADFGVEGQAYEEVLESQLWEAAADVAARVVADVIANPPAEPSVLNVNVPNLPVDEMKGWRWTNVASMPPHPVAKAVLEHKRGHKGSYHVKLAWGDELEQPIDTDTGAVLDGYVSLTWLSRLQALPTDGAGPFDALDDLLTR
jgi:5'-nucleotidase